MARNTLLWGINMARSMYGNNDNKPTAMPVPISCDRCIDLEKENRQLKECIEELESLLKEDNGTKVWQRSSGERVFGD